MEQAREAAQVVTEFFQGNPFGTHVGKMIEQATDGSLSSENWALNMDICDAINSLQDGPRDAVRAIRKRLQMTMGKNNTCVLFTLTVLETCVKNCDIRFLQLVTQKDFCQDLIKLIGSKYDPPQVVQEKVLGLIQTWSDAFRKHPDLNGVCEIYDELKAKGVDFPMTDLDSVVPILTPQRIIRVQDSAPIAHAVSPRFPAQTDDQNRLVPLTLNVDQLQKLRTDLDVVNGNIKVLLEMLTELHPGKEDPEDLQLLQDLHKTCKQMQRRIVELLQRVSNEEVTSELLLINDEMNNVFAKYDRYWQNRSSSKQQESDLTSQNPTPNQQQESLIDWNGAGVAPAKTASSVYADNRNIDTLDIGLGAAAQQKGSGVIAPASEPATLSPSHQQTQNPSGGPTASN